MIWSIILMKSLFALRSTCVLKATLSVSAENTKGALFGVLVVELATVVMALRNQFGGIKASSSGVDTGESKTDDRSFGKCDLLIKFYPHHCVCLRGLGSF